MPWSTADAQDVRDRYQLIAPNKLAKDVTVDVALSDAENTIRPWIEGKFGTGAAASPTVAMLVAHLAAAFCLLYVNGPSAHEYVAALKTETKEYIDGLATLPGAAEASSSVTNATDTSPIFSLGRPEGWPEPSDTIGTDTTERRTF